MAEEKKTTRKTAAKKDTEKGETAKTAAAKSAAKAAKEDNTSALEEMKAQYEAQMATMKADMEAQMAAMRETMMAAQKPQVIQVSPTTEQIHFLWMADVADDNIQDFGPGGMYGRIIGKQGEFFVPKNDLSRILDNITRMCLDRRWLIVLSGLNDDERDALGVNYNEGELLDRKAFAKLLELGDKVLEFFPALCEGHKEMVSKRYYEGWKDHNPNIRRETVAELNRMAKEAGMKENAFSAIIEEMNAAQV